MATGVEAARQRTLDLPLSDEALEDRIGRAAAAYRSYRRTSVEDRVRWLRAAADVLDADTDAVAELMTTEMGKTLSSAKAPISLPVS